MNYKRASIVVLASHIYTFPHRGSPQGCEVFNEAEPMYPEASIKTLFPKKHDGAWSK
jgi:hypothetical protein